MIEEAEPTRRLAGRHVDAHAFPDGRHEARRTGRAPACTAFEEDRRVGRATITEREHLGAALAHIQAIQTAASPEPAWRAPEAAGHPAPAAATTARPPSSPSVPPSRVAPSSSSRLDNIGDVSISNSCRGICLDQAAEIHPSVECDRRAREDGAVTTTFRDIKADLLRRIGDGSLPPGSLLPGEMDLAGRYGCARATVNRAMRELAEEGIVERRRRAGTRVRTAPIREARFRIPLVRVEVERRGAAYRYALVEREAVEAPGWLRARLGLGRGEAVLHVLAAHLADGAPYQLEDRWISLAALPQAEDEPFAAAGPNEWLVTTVPFSDVEIGLSAVAADALAAEHLDCARGEALFQVERSTWWQGRALTHVRLLHRPGHRMTTRY